MVEGLFLCYDISKMCHILRELFQPVVLIEVFLIHVQLLESTYYIQRQFPLKQPIQNVLEILLMVVGLIERVPLVTFPQLFEHIFRMDNVQLF